MSYHILVRTSVDLDLQPNRAIPEGRCTGRCRSVWAPVPKNHGDVASDIRCIAAIERYMANGHTGSTYANCIGTCARGDLALSRRALVGHEESVDRLSPWAFRRRLSYTTRSLDQ